MNEYNSSETDILSVLIIPTIHAVEKYALEVFYLGVIIIAGMSLNIIAFTRLIKQPKIPTASTNFLTGPYYTRSFVLFKINLTIMDFSILLIHALGKMIWLLTYEWKFGHFGCKIYQFLSAFTYYGNSNIVVAIGIDRLIVVYTSHIQGATSKRRVRLLLLCTWFVAAICALPQMFVWINAEVSLGFNQCTTVWQVNAHRNISTNTESQEQLLYEMFHQAMVFWLPFFILLVSYIFIILKVISYTFVGKQKHQCHAKLAMRKQTPITATYKKTSLIRVQSRLHIFYSTVTTYGIRTKHDCSNRFLVSAMPSLDMIDEKTILRRVKSEFFNRLDNKMNHIYKGCASSRRFSANSTCTIATTNLVNSRNENKNLLKLKNNNNNALASSITGNSEINSLVTFSLDSTPTSDGTLIKINDKMHDHLIINIRQIIAKKMNYFFCKKNAVKQTTFKISSCHFSQRQQKAKQIWKRQLRSRVFTISLMIVIAHCALWLPYNLLNTIRFIDAGLYEWTVANGGFLLEDLIVLNSVVNPLLYGFENKWRLRK